jgi:hypothetical protein
MYSIRKSKLSGTIKSNLKLEKVGIFLENLKFGGTGWVIGPGESSESRGR